MPMPCRAATKPRAQHRAAPAPQATPHAVACLVVWGNGDSIVHDYPRRFAGTTRVSAEQRSPNAKPLLSPAYAAIFASTSGGSVAEEIAGEFDYIIVGAGSAGCLLANRLSADPGTRVLILEAGGRDNWIWFHIPVGYLFAIGNPRSDWMFKTEPEPGLNGRSLNYPRGKAIGGSSAINAMIYMRGQAADYDHWRQLGLTGWGYDDVLPCFRKLEDHFLGESEHHGVGGGWRIEAPRLSWAVLDAVGDAAEQMGIRKVSDFNTGDNEGVGYFHVNQKRGRRWSSARGFLKPVLARTNLRLEKNVLVDRLIVENGRAVGVVFSRDGQVFEARSQGEVILCAGSIG